MEKCHLAYSHFGCRVCMSTSLGKKANDPNPWVVLSLFSPVRVLADAWVSALSVGSESVVCVVLFRPVGCRAGVISLPTVFTGRTGNGPPGCPTDRTAPRSLPGSHFARPRFWSLRCQSGVFPLSAHVSCFCCAVVFLGFDFYDL